MRLSVVLFSVFQFLIPPAVIVTTLLYLYPIFFGCDFPPPSKPQPACYLDRGDQQNHAQAATPEVAPFRLLVFGDPQLEGDTSLPDPNAPIFPSLRRLDQFNLNHTLRWNADFALDVGSDFFKEDVQALFQSYRKRLDLLGNDFYLAHIYRTLHWWLQPTHVAVLGDLLGSQWVSDDEFQRRGARYWNRVFRHGRRVEDAITQTSKREVLGQDPAWSRRIINPPGNHDIGYAGDLTRARLDRFERTFGKANWEVKFQLPAPPNSTTPPELRLVILNSMNLDGPAQDPSLQAETYTFINDRVISAYSLQHPITSRSSATIILTHIPLHKPGGVCTDGPHFSHYADGTLREQNHLSRRATAPILEGILGMSGNALVDGGGRGRAGLVLAGHDHEGCDVYHHVPADAERDGGEWRAMPWRRARGVRGFGGIPGVREITVRSMMGSFGGSAGMLSAWFDAEEGEWRFEYGTCAVGVQHIWWAVHVLDVVVFLLLVGSGVARAFEKPEVPAKRARRLPSTPEVKREKKEGYGTPWVNGHQSVRHGGSRSRSKSIGTPRHRSSTRRKREET